MPVDFIIFFSITFLAIYAPLLCILNITNAFYFFITVWLFFPNHGDDIIGIGDVPMFTFVEFVGASVLALRAARETIPDAPMANFEQRLIGFTIAAAFLQHTFLFLVPLEFVQPRPIPATTDYVKVFLPEFSAALFFYACFKCIKTREHINTVLKIIVTFSIILFIEYFIVSNIIIMRSYLYEFSFNKQGRFDSILLTDYGIVSFICSVSAIACVYFMISRGKWYYIIPLFTSALLTIINAQRGTVLSLVVAAVIYFIYGCHKQRKLGFAVVAVSAFAAIFLIDPIINSISSSLKTEFTMRKITQYKRYDSLLVRYGIQQRAFEVTSYFFPLGVGNGMLKFYMNSDVPKTFTSTNEHVTAGYERVANGIKITSAHNGYTETIASYGILGFVGILYFGYVFIRNSFMVKIPPHTADMDHKLFICINSILVFCALFFIFSSFPKVYIVYFFAIRVSCFFYERYKLKKPEPAAHTSLVHPAHS